MGIKKALKKVGKALAWPFVHLAHALFSKKGFDALKVAYREMAKTPLGKIIVPVVAQFSTRKDLGDLSKLTQATNEIVSRASAVKLEWKTSLIHAGVELVVQALKHGW